jgi:hypothetical protein
LKKLIATVSCLLFALFSLVATTSATNVEDYTISEDYRIYDIPGSNSKGRYSVTLNAEGTADSNGLYTFIAHIDTEPGETYTKITSWNSNFPVKAVIVNSNDLYNLYQYDRNIRRDTDLLAPDNPDGSPGNVSKITLVFNPKEFPEEPEPLSTLTPEPIELVRNFLYRNLSILAIPLVVAFYLLGNLMGRLRPTPSNDQNGQAVEPTDTTTSSINMDNLPSPGSSNFGDDDETQFRRTPPYSRYGRNRYFNNSDR